MGLLRDCEIFVNLRLKLYSCDGVSEVVKYLEADLFRSVARGPAAGLGLEWTQLQTQPLLRSLMGGLFKHF